MLIAYGCSVSPKLLTGLTMADGEKIPLATGILLYADEESGKYQVNTAGDLGETYLKIPPAMRVITP